MSASGRHTHGGPPGGSHGGLHAGPHGGSHGGSLEGALAGQRVLVPRAEARGDHLAELVLSLGGEPVMVPLIEHTPPADEAAFAAAIDRWNAGAYDWAAITSVRGAQAFARAGATLSGGRIASVGSTTTAALESLGFCVDLEPERFTGESLARALVAKLMSWPAPDGRASVLLPLSAIADTALETGLIAAGHRPERIDAYRTSPVAGDPEADAALAPSIDAALVLSASAARALAARFPTLHEHARLAAIGEPTARELRSLGMPPTVVARQHTASGTVTALARLTETSKPS